MPASRPARLSHYAHMPPGARSHPLSLAALTRALPPPLPLVLARVQLPARAVSGARARLFSPALPLPPPRLPSVSVCAVRWRYGRD